MLLKSIWRNKSKTILIQNNNIGDKEGWEVSVQKKNIKPMWHLYKNAKNSLEDKTASLEIYQ